MSEPRVTSPLVPTFELGQRIPKLLHQTFPVKDLPEELKANTEALKRLNPEWTYTLFDDHDVKQFIEAHYGREMLKLYLSINPRYGPARADLFRYLLIYKFGGVYLDIKSTFTQPIDNVIEGNESFVISQWPDKRQHTELTAIPGGEFQQWHIISAPGHPFLRAVIEAVVANIQDYRPWRQGVGRFGVLRTTGPIAYTLAIYPLLSLYPFKRVADESELGLKYSITSSDHRSLFVRHYTGLSAALVKGGGISGLLSQGYAALRGFKRWALRESDSRSSPVAVQLGRLLHRLRSAPARP